MRSLCVLFWIPCEALRKALASSLRLPGLRGPELQRMGVAMLAFQTALEHLSNVDE